MAKHVALLISGLLLVPFLGQAQLKTYSFEQLDSLEKTEKRPIMVFIYTDWCTYCAAMEKTSLRNERVMELLNKQYYFVDLNAEDEKDILLPGHTFRFKPSGNKQGIHELAEQLGTLNGKVSFPTVCFLNSDYEIVFQYNQFISASDLIKVLEALQPVVKIGLHDKQSDERIE